MQKQLYDQFKEFNNRDGKKGPINSAEDHEKTKYPEQISDILFFYSL